MLRVTLDSNVLKTDREKVLAVAAERGIELELAYTTVTLREEARDAGQDELVIPETGVWNESTWDSGAVYAEEPPPVIYESFVIGESRLDYAALGGHESQTTLDGILAVISNGSYPKPGLREDLATGERRQLRDAMILEAHRRERRDILVSNDVTAYIGKDDSRRVLLEIMCQTKIFTVAEFIDHLEASTA